jgi:hypothetical protein
VVWLARRAEVAASGLLEPQAAMLALARIAVATREMVAANRATLLFYRPTHDISATKRGRNRLMCEQNRVTPLGDVEAFPLRGAFTGNRGRLHDGHRIVRFHAGDLWIICALHLRDRWNEQWLPRRFTWLFFHDEAVALAAGHRPCGECRHISYIAYQDAWSAATPRSVPPSAGAMNRQLHVERIVRRTHLRRFHEMPWHDLPNGTFVLTADGEPQLVRGRELVAWTREGYGLRFHRPRGGTATVVTPPSSVAVLRAGYPVQIDEKALG